MSSDRHAINSTNCLATWRAFLCKDGKVVEKALRCDRSEDHAGAHECNLHEVSENDVCETKRFSFPTQLAPIGKETQ